MATEDLHFVLVHGAMHGAWCWQPTLPFLEASPRVASVTPVDLCGHGTRRDAKALEAITRADYEDDVVSAIEGGDLRNVVLVGHSLAGITLPAVATRVRERLRHVVFLATTTPPAGESVDDFMKSHPSSPVRRGVTGTQEMFCNDLDAEQTEWLTSRLGPQPPGPMNHRMEALQWPPGLPATYILLERDACLPPDYQREQARGLGIERVVSLDCGHSAFVAAPKALAELLLEIV